MNTTDLFWGDNLNILIDKKRLTEFFPTNQQSIEERINSLSRLIIYISIIISFYQEKPTAMYFGIILLILIYLMWTNQTSVDTTIKEPFTKVIKETTEKNTINLPSLNSKECVMPTAENPFMNFLLGDNPNRPAACKTAGVQQMASNMLNQQLFNDVDDLFSKSTNERMFVTMPSTTNVPDTMNFANWLSKDTPDCKLDKNCPPFDDLRLNKQLLQEENLQVSI
jgi:hypothetical protein